MAAEYKRAKHTQCAWRAGADVMANQINATAAILAWMGLALIYLYFTVLSCVSWHALQPHDYSNLIIAIPVIKHHLQKKEYNSVSSRLTSHW